jgi:transketolase
LKPLNPEKVATLCRRYSIIVTAEEHSIYGGLGSAVSEIAASHAPNWICRIGVQDRFTWGCGSYPYVMKEHKLDSASVIRQVQSFLSKLTGMRSISELGDVAA